MVIQRHFWNMEIATPVIGKLGRLSPGINPAIAASTNVADDPIEEELRLPVSMVPTSIHLRYHESTEGRLRCVSLRSLNLDEIVGMKLTTGLCHFHLKGKGFCIKSWKNRSLMIGRSWDGCGHVCDGVPRLGWIGICVRKGDGWSSIS